MKTLTEYYSDHNTIGFFEYNLSDNFIKSLNNINEATASEDLLMLEGLWQKIKNFVKSKNPKVAAAASTAAKAGYNVIGKIKGIGADITKTYQQKVEELVAANDEKERTEAISNISGWIDILKKDGKIDDKSKNELKSIFLDLGFITAKANGETNLEHKTKEDLSKINKKDPEAVTAAQQEIQNVKQTVDGSADKGDGDDKTSQTTEEPVEPKNVKPAAELLNIKNQKALTDLVNSLLKEQLSESLLINEENEKISDKLKQTISNNKELQTTFTALIGSIITFIKDAGRTPNCETIQSVMSSLGSLFNKNRKFIQKRNDLINAMFEEPSNNEK